MTASLRRSSSGLAGLRHFLFGYDVFISYSRADATVYAAQLAHALVDLDLRVYLDQLGSTPDAALPPAVLAPLQASRALVLIGTPAAARSPAVAQELRHFGALTKVGIIIPIDVAGSCAGADWAEAIRGLARTTEQWASVVGGHVSRDVVQRVASSCTFTRRNRRMRRLFWTTLAATVLVLVVGAVAATLIERKARREVARSQRELATAEAASRLETRASVVLSHFRDGDGELEALRDARDLARELLALVDVGSRPVALSAYPTVRPLAVLQEVLESVRERERVPLPRPVLAADISVDGKKAVVVEQGDSGSKGPAIQIVNLQTGELARAGESRAGAGDREVSPDDALASAGVSVVWSPAGERFVVSSEDAIELWAADGPVARWPGSPAAFAFHPTRALLVVWDERSGRVGGFDFDGTPRDVYPFHARSRPYALAFRGGDGSLLASSGEGDVIEVWSDARRTVRRYQFMPRVSSFGESGGVVDQVLLTGGHLVAQASNGHFCVFDLETGRRRQWERFGLLDHGLVAPDGGAAYVIAFVEDQRRIHVRDLTAAGDDLVFPAAGEVSFNRGGSLVAAAQGRSVQVRTVGGGRRAELTGHAMPIRRLRFTDEASTLITVDASAVHVWDLSVRAKTSEVQSRRPDRTPPAGGDSSEAAESSATSEGDELLHARIEANQVRVWDSLARLIAAIDLPASDEPYRTTRFTDGGRKVVVSTRWREYSWSLGALAPGALLSRADRWLANAGPWNGGNRYVRDAANNPHR